MTEHNDVTEPAVDLFRLGDTHHVLVDLPGMSAKDVQVRAVDWEVTVEGECRSIPASAGDLVLAERPSGRWERRVRLPSDADPSTLTADCTNGVLHLAASTVRNGGSRTRRERTVEVDAGERQLASAEDRQDNPG